MRAIQRIRKVSSLRPESRFSQRPSWVRPVIVIAGAGLALLVGYQARHLFQSRTQQAIISSNIPYIDPNPTSSSLSLATVIHSSKHTIVSVRLFKKDILVSEQSGFIVDSTGLTITTDMDPSTFDQLSIKTADGRTFPASLLEYDTSTGLCMIKVHVNEPAYFHSLSLLSKGDRPIKTGDFVITLGFMDSHNNEDFSFGVIKSFKEDDAGRKQQYFTSMAIEGNYSAGGPVLNMNGKVIGVNKTTSSTDTKSQIFIPIECGRSLLERIKQSNKGIPHSVDKQLAYVSNMDKKLSDHKKDCFFR